MERALEQPKEIRKPCIISCGVLRQEIDRLVARGELDADIIFLNKYLHIDYRKLHDALKASLLRHRDKKPVVVYGDVCLGFNNEMQDLVEECGAVKVDGLNCIDCLLGGKGTLLEIDPDHVYLFLTPAFIDFFENCNPKSKEETRKMFAMLKGIILVDSMGGLETYRDRIERISDQTGLPVLEHKHVDPAHLSSLIREAVGKVRK